MVTNAYNVIFPYISTLQAKVACTAHKINSTTYNPKDVNPAPNKNLFIRTIPAMNVH
jgi:hypothetical protein